MKASSRMASRALVSVRPAGIRKIRPTGLKHLAPAQRQGYSTGKEAAGQASSSHLPWIAGASVVTVAGVWLSMPSSKPSSDHQEQSHAHKIKEALSPDEEKKKKAHEDFVKSMKADAPKDEHRGSSVQNHAKAAETHEHKVVKGKFSGREFDNHDTKHSADPCKDFEFIEKKEAEGAPKS